MCRTDGERDETQRSILSGNSFSENKSLSIKKQEEGGDYCTFEVLHF